MGWKIIARRALSRAVMLLGVLVAPSAWALDHPWELSRDGDTWVMALITAGVIVVGAVVAIVVRGRKQPPQAPRAAVVRETSQGPVPNTVELYLSLGLCLCGVVGGLVVMVSFAMSWLDGTVGLEGSLTTGLGYLGLFAAAIACMGVGIVGVVRSARMPPRDDSA